AFEFDSYRVIDGASSGDESGDADRDDGRWARQLRYHSGVFTGSEGDAGDATVDDLIALADPGFGANRERAVASVRSVLEAAVDRADNRIELWNLALLSSAAVVYVPRNLAMVGAVLVEVSADADEAIVAPQVVVILEEGAQADVVVRYRSGEDGELLVAGAEQLSVGANARLKLAVLQRLNDESLYFHHGHAEIGRDAVLHRTEASLGSDFVKTRFTSDITGPGADVDLNGVYFALGEQHMDLRTVQNHRAARATSRAYYRGAVRDESHSIYQGLISVAPGAPGTDAYLTNKNLILSEAARADSIPSLNIRTDDVRCSHGSTTGRLDPAQVFYLQSRGYSRNEARRLLVQGHFEDLIAQTNESLHDEIRELIARRIDG
ncbi:MAG: Fe-S cluster assembly protein SufD, partial [Spirochaetaceae bacterium]